MATPNRREVTQSKVYLGGAGTDLVKKVGEFVGELKEATKTGY
jgi:hypothetical protein